MIFVLSQFIIEHSNDSYLERSSKMRMTFILCKVLKIIEIRLVVDVDQLEIMRVVLLQLSLELNHVGLSNFWNQSVKKYEYVDGVM